MGNFIKQIRKDRELSSEQLAEKAGTSPQQINYLENGKRKLTWEWIQRLARALECHPMEITDGPISGALLPKDEQEKKLLQKFRGFNDGEKQMFSHMLDTFTPETRRKHKVDEGGKDGDKASKGRKKS